MKILFVIRSLDFGGAERQLVSLASGLRDIGHDASIAVFYGDGALITGARRAGVQILFLQKRGRWDLVPFVFRFFRVLRNQKPDVVHGYLEMSNVLSLFARLIRPRPLVVWGIRSSALPLSEYGSFRALGYRIERLSARFTDHIIVNSEAGRADAVRSGFPSEHMTVIPNGIAVERFVRNEEAGRAFRETHGVPAAAEVIGLVARLDPMKDHSSFLRAAQLLLSADENVYFLCVGNGPERLRNELLDLTRDLELERHVFWIPSQNDVVPVYSALDLATSSSAFGEGWPNVVGEAMACGVPCVVTDVGDSARIVGDAGWVVPSRDPAALAEAWRQALGVLRADPVGVRAAARSRIVENFTEKGLVERTDRVLRAISKGEGQG